MGAPQARWRSVRRKAGDRANGLRRGRGSLDIDCKHIDTLHMFDRQQLGKYTDAATLLAALAQSCPLLPIQPPGSKRVGPRLRTGRSDPLRLGQTPPTPFPQTLSCQLNPTNQSRCKFEMEWYPLSQADE